MPSFVVTLAGLLAFQGLLLCVLGDTGTITITDSQILDLANTFFSDDVGWIIAVVLLVPYVLLTLNGYRKRLAAGLDTGPPILLGLRMAVVIAGVIVAVSISNADRGVPLAVLIFIGIVILVDSGGTSTPSGATPRRPAVPASPSRASAWSSSR